MTKLDLIPAPAHAATYGDWFENHEDTCWSRYFTAADTFTSGPEPVRVSVAGFQDSTGAVTHHAIVEAGGGVCTLTAGQLRELSCAALLEADRLDQLS
ncbi:hypothetical protein [Mycobacteroides chelonae]|uniref:hypothetical protein n=1 Tax=Mycobacteroides chelonae TaxID=1774 RepID=UPI0009930BB6|nr:hypothetical protein [Mycobacteroides chelonae]